MSLCHYVQVQMMGYLQNAEGLEGVEFGAMIILLLDTEPVPVLFKYALQFQFRILFGDSPDSGNMFGSFMLSYSTHCTEEGNFFSGSVVGEVQADCICIVYLCVL